MTKTNQSTNNESNSSGKSRQRVCLFLGGSFFPLHQGHINLFLAAKEYLETYQHQQVVRGILCPNHPSALRKKFSWTSSSGSDEDDDNRTKEAQEVLLRNRQTHDDDDDDDSSYLELELVWDDRLLKAPTNTGMRLVFEAIRDEQLQDYNVDKVIQVVGGDSRVRAVLRGKRPGEVLLVIDARGVPSENAEILQSGHWVTTTNNNQNIPPMSSTCLRFLNPHKYPSCTISDFDLSWLTDTGITLGAGRQGLVRLMRLGGTQLVAVKIFKRGGKLDAFPLEEPVWQHLNNNNGHHGEEKGLMVTPKLYATGTTPDGKFSYIVTEVGICLDLFLPRLHYEYVWKPKDEKGVKRFLQESVTSYPLEEEGLPEVLRPSVPTTEPERIRLLAKFIRGMLDCQRKLEAAGVVHRDLKVSNFLYLPSCGEVRLCDFGVALKVPTKSTNGDNFDSFVNQKARGSLRMYPMVAIDSFYYDYGCDEYVLKNSIAEVINERPIYHECGDNVSEAIYKRKAGDHPSWDSHFVSRLKTLRDNHLSEDARYLLEEIDACESNWSSYDGGACPNRRIPRPLVVLEDSSSS